jgi:hypothetical protein
VGFHLFGFWCSYSVPNVFPPSQVPNDFSNISPKFPLCFLRHFKQVPQVPNVCSQVVPNCITLYPIVFAPSWTHILIELSQRESLLHYLFVLGECVMFFYFYLFIDDETIKCYNKISQQNIVSYIYVCVHACLNNTN